MKIFTLVVALLITTPSIGQDTSSTYARQAAQNSSESLNLKPGKSRFMLRGYYHSGFNAMIGEEDNTYNFDFGSINPILMFKQSDRLFFEAEFEGTMDHGFDWNIEYADISYVINKYMTVRSGLILLPFGTFVEKLHPAWINRLATKPLGFGHHGGILPSSDVGFELRGAFYTGSLKLNYQLYAINGFRLNTGSREPEEGGMLHYGYHEDDNSNKTIGGRLGVFPFSNSMMEIGLSAMSGVVGADDGPYEDVSAQLYAVDLSLVKNLSFISSVVDIKGQYNYIQIDDANYPIPGDTLGLFYDFNNVSTSYYAQLALRPAYLENAFFRNTELVFRYSALKTPEGSAWEQKPTEIAFGLNYWIDWRTVIKIGYILSDSGEDAHEQTGEHEHGGPSDMFYIHWAMGF